MVEHIDNIIQFSAAAIMTIVTAISFNKKRKQEYFLLTCFYGCISLGNLYWTVYTWLNSYHPSIFYVSDISWIGAYLFVLTLVFYLEDENEKTKWTPWMIIPFVVGIPQMGLYMYYGDIVLNLIMCMLTMSVAAFAIRGLAFERFKASEDRPWKKLFYIVIIILIGLEYALWTSSCIWTGAGLENPYFWFDFLLTIFFVAIFPVMRKVVSYD